MWRESEVPVTVRQSGTPNWAPGPHPSYPSEPWSMLALVSQGPVISQPWSWMPVAQDKLDMVLPSVWQVWQAHKQP